MRRFAAPLHLPGQGASSLHLGSFSPTDVFLTLTKLNDRELFFHISRAADIYPTNSIAF